MLTHAFVIPSHHGDEHGTNRFAILCVRSGDTRAGHRNIRLARPLSAARHLEGHLGVHGPDRFQKPSINASQRRFHIAGVRYQTATQNLRRARHGGQRPRDQPGRQGFARCNREPALRVRVNNARGQVPGVSGHSAPCPRC